MWFQRDFLTHLPYLNALPIKVLKGPRQVGKTSLLERLGRYRPLYFDDLAIRRAAQTDPKLFFEQFSGPLLLDEATLVPEIFLELKRRVDEERRTSAASLPKGKKANSSSIDIWITGSNQTLLQKNVRESLAGRASYFDLNTLSIHEHGDASLSNLLLRGGWPELRAHPETHHTAYLNDLISTFIEKDIIAAAGIEKHTAFTRTLQLSASRVGQLFNASDIAKNVSVDLTTVQSWIAIAEQNGILRILRPYFSNLNQRLIKTPKIYFEDAALATRFQGWTEFQPLFTSPSIGFLIETIALNEITRFFQNRGERPEVFFIRSKEKVEIDFLIQLPNQRFLAVECKMTPVDFTREQIALLDSTKLNVIQRWVVSPQAAPRFENSEVVEFKNIWKRLSDLM